jgi:glycosyltransferase involved in cell wall biosynthesis
MLKRQGFNVLVIAPIDEYISYLNDSHFTKHIPLNHLCPLGLNPINDIKLAFELRAVLKREKPDLVLNYTVKPNIYGTWVATSLGIPVISTLTGLGSGFTGHSLMNGVLSMLYRKAMSKAFKIVFHNTEDRSIFIKKEIVSDKNSLVISGSGVDTDKFNMGPRNEKDKFKFLFVGRLIRDKGIREFVAAARKAKSILPRSEFCVVGPLPENDSRAIEKKELLNWVESGSIKYYGNQKDIRPFLATSDCFVLPSYREGLPKSVIEAMATSLPIITTNVPGCRETVEDGVNGFLVPVKNSLALSEAMVKMYNASIEERVAMSNQSRKAVVEKFESKLIIKKYVGLINEALFPNQVLDESKSTYRTIL